MKTIMSSTATRGIAVLSLVAIISGWVAHAQPPGAPPGAPAAPPGGMNMGSIAVSGQVTSTNCTVATGTQCSRTGSSNEVWRNLTYYPATGTFNGTLTANQCSNNLFGRDSNGVLFTTGVGHTASCYEQTLPAPAYSAPGPRAAPTRGAVAYSLYGVLMYGPYEAGFSLGQACTNGKGSCAAGLDLSICEKQLEYECGAENVTRGMLMDNCGGHASPYHYHTRMNCDEALNRNRSSGATATSGHSPLVGIALDGRGVYGQEETTGVAPTNLDACGGHVGPVPVISINGITGHTGDSVYHYHTQSESPFILGCFGPATVAQCRAANPTTCGVGFVNVTSATGTVNYDTDCPCEKVSTATVSSTTATVPATTTMTTASLATTTAFSSTASPTSSANTPLTTTTVMPPAPNTTTRIGGGVDSRQPHVTAIVFLAVLCGSLMAMVC